MDIPSPLADSILKGRASLFLGAGASQAVGLPSATELASDLANAAGADIPIDIRALDLVADYLYAQPEFGEGWVRHHVIDSIRKVESAGIANRCDAHRALARTTWQTAFTTNYDNVLEIAYAIEEERAQDLKPLYRGDSPIVRRRERGQLNYLKLNGSADEAERNPDHHLVLTFSEQQEARSRNGHFYEALSEAAINGPIVFVGFNFTHPGAHASASSPEFRILKSLLGELGPLAQNHYCVLPHRKDDVAFDLLVGQLKAAGVVPIDGTLQEFSESVTRLRRASAPSALVRQHVDIRVGNDTLRFSRSEWASYQSVFEVVHEGMWNPGTTRSSVRDAINGNTTWDTFFADEMFPREVTTEMLNLLDTQIRRAELVVVEAPLGWGKTFALRQLAAEAARRGIPSLWMNPSATVDLMRDGARYTVGTWDHRVVSAIVHRINSVEIDGTAIVPIIFIDDAPERSDEVLALLKELRRRDLAARVIFSIRDVDARDLHDSAPEMDKARWISPAKGDTPENLIRQLDRLLSYCESHSVLEFVSPTERELVRSRVLADDAHQLVLLALFVIFDREHRPFREIIRSMWDSIDSEMSRDVLLRVCALHRFGNRVTPRLAALVRTYPTHQAAEALQAAYSLVNENLLVERFEQEEPVLATIHTIFAQEYLRVADIDAEYLNDLLLALFSNMSSHPYDVEMLKRLAKRITDFDIPLSNVDLAREVLETAAVATNYNDVICQQLAKFLLHQGETEAALSWIDRAIESSSNPTLIHSKGNILRHRGLERLRHGEDRAGFEDIEEARACFAQSRSFGESSEYGFVTHMDMLIALIDQENEDAQMNLLAEGISLFREGLAVVPEDKYNTIAASRFRTAFDPGAREVNQLIDRLKTLPDTDVSVPARVFVARELARQGRHDEGLAFLEKGLDIGTDDPLLALEGCHLSLSIGESVEAKSWLAEAKLAMAASTGNVEAEWRLPYWEQIVRFAEEDFRGAKQALRELIASGVRPRDRLPRGYLWKKSAIGVKNPSFEVHAKLHRGRVLDGIGPHGDGRIRVTNQLGDWYDIRFRLQYFRERTLAPGSVVDFVVTLLPSGLRADDPRGTPFGSRMDDVFV